MKKVLLLAMTLLLLHTLTVSAQEDEEVFGVILFAEGAQLSIFRQGELLRYDLFEDDVLGMPLLQGDMVQTEDNSFVEIQMLPSESVVKVAENTTFEITSIGNQGGGSFELLYGRVRAKVSRLNDEQFQIRGRSAIAGVRGTDFGYDYVTRIGESVTPTTSVYCFEGSVEVVGGQNDAIADANGSPGQDEVEPDGVLIEAFEMVAVSEDRSAGPLTPVEVRFDARQIDQEITDYWRDNSFKSVAVNPKEIENVFPSIKEDLRAAKAQAALAAEKRAFLASGQTLRAFRESRQQAAALQTPAPARDPFPLIQPISVASLIPEIQTVAYQANGLRVAGAFMGTLGVLAETAGILFTFYSEELGLDSAFSENYGPALMGAGGVSLSIGLISLLIDLAR